MIIERKYSTKHEHLVEYLDNSLTCGAHPMPIGEKIDDMKLFDPVEFVDSII